MICKQDIKYLLRSGSLKFMLNSKCKHTLADLALYRWHNNPIYYRPGTFDASIIYNILLRKGKKGEYWIRKDLSPHIIFDIGGNIGITAIYFANRYPNAKIYTFEPVAENYTILTKNISPYKNITSFNFGLGSRNDIFKIYPPYEKENKGGFTCYPEAKDDNGFDIEIKNIQDFIDQEGLKNIDLIKVDTEGCEYEILTTIDPCLLKNVEWIIGELHGNKDYELLQYLSRFFSIGIQKSIKQTEFIFNACKK